MRFRSITGVTSNNLESRFMFIMYIYMYVVKNIVLVLVPRVDSDE